jgi:hypothetical protein
VSSYHTQLLLLLKYLPLITPAISYTRVIGNSRLTFSLTTKSAARALHQFAHYELYSFSFCCSRKVPD